MQKIGQVSVGHHADRIHRHPSEFIRLTDIPHDRGRIDDFTGGRIAVGEKIDRLGVKREGRLEGIKRRRFAIGLLPADKLSGGLLGRIGRWSQLLLPSGGRAIESHHSKPGRWRQGKDRRYQLPLGRLQPRAGHALGGVEHKDQPLGIERDVVIVFHASCRRCGIGDLPRRKLKTLPADSPPFLPGDSIGTKVFSADGAEIVDQIGPHLARQRGENIDERSHPLGAICSDQRPHDAAAKRKVALEGGQASQPGENLDGCCISPLDCRRRHAPAERLDPFLIGLRGQPASQIGCGLLWLGSQECRRQARSQRHARLWQFAGQRLEQVLPHISIHERCDQGLFAGGTHQWVFGAEADPHDQIGRFRRGEAAELIENVDPLLRRARLGTRGGELCNGGKIVGCRHWQEQQSQDGGEEPLQTQTCGLPTAGWHNGLRRTAPLLGPR